MALGFYILSFKHQEMTLLMMIAAVVLLAMTNTIGVKLTLNIFQTRKLRPWTFPVVLLTFLLVLLMLVLDFFFFLHRDIEGHFLFSAIHQETELGVKERKGEDKI